MPKTAAAISEAANAPRPGSGEAAVRFGGTYSDPGHPGCIRKVKMGGKASNGTQLVTITGADEDGVPWKVKGVATGKTITIDFSPKGGPTDITATWTGLGLKFPDGNLWSKLS